MPIAQIPGAVRLRRNQFGIETTLNTNVAATRRVPWRGGIIVNPNWTNPDSDFGSLDPIALPTTGALEISSTKTGPLYFNDIPIRGNAGLVGGVSPTTSGTAKTWDWQVASLTTDIFDIFTNQTGDDTANDGKIGISGVIDSLEDSHPQDLGAVTISDAWIFSSATIGSTLTTGLSVDSAAVPLLARDTTVKMDSTAGAIGTTLLTDAVHDVTVRVNNNLDSKRFMNGSNGANKLGGYGRGARVIELVLTVAKTAAMITEANTFLTAVKPSRFFDVGNYSTSEASVGIPYSDRHRGAFRLFETSESEIAGNIALVLTYRAYYDSVLGYAYRRTTVNKQATVAVA